MLFDIFRRGVCAALRKAREELPGIQYSEMQHLVCVGLQAAPVLWPATQVLLLEEVLVLELVLELLLLVVGEVPVVLEWQPAEAS